MTVSDKIKYDCTTCPYPRYKDGSVIFCDVCIRKIKPECMPDWAKEALAKIKQQEKEKKQRNREER